jgi:putative ferrous iron transport protein C
MTPSEVKVYLVERHRAALGDIAVHFGSSPDAVRQVLGHWLAKGRVRLLTERSCAGGCSCAKRPDEVYEWVRPA